MLVCSDGGYGSSPTVAAPLNTGLTTCNLLLSNTEKVLTMQCFYFLKVMVFSVTQQYKKTRFEQDYFCALTQKATIVQTFVFSVPRSKENVLYHRALNMHFKNPKMKRTNICSQHEKQKKKKARLAFLAPDQREISLACSRVENPFSTRVEISVVLKAQASELISLGTRDVSFAESPWV